MKLTAIFESAPTKVTQPKVWHITEKANLASLEEDGVMYPGQMMRGGRYHDYRLHFFTSLDSDIVEEIESVVRFGGIDLDDEEMVERRLNTPLVLLELDMKELANYDEQMEQQRVWYQDEAVSKGAGIWTPQPIPFVGTMKVLKTL